MHIDGPAVVSLTFDDGFRCQFEHAVPVLNDLHLPATFFLVANTDRIHTDGYAHPDWSKTDWNDRDIGCLTSMLEEGHEIGSHSVHHRDPFLDNDPVGEAVNSKYFIEARLPTTVDSYCYPFCHVTPAIKTAVTEAGYKQARCCGYNEAYYEPHTNEIDYYQIQSRFISENHFERHFVGHHEHKVGLFNGENVNDWIRAGRWHVLMYHGIGGLTDGYFSIPVEEFRRQMQELASLRDAGSARVVTFRDGADYIRGIA